MKVFFLSPSWIRHDEGISDSIFAKVQKNNYRIYRHVSFDMIPIIKYHILSQKQRQKQFFYSATNDYVTINI